MYSPLPSQTKPPKDSPGSSPFTSPKPLKVPSSLLIQINDLSFIVELLVTVISYELGLPQRVPISAETLKKLTPLVQSQDVPLDPEPLLPLMICEAPAFCASSQVE